MTIEELGKKVKLKYPQYKDLSDFEVGKKVLSLYPQYQDMIDEKEVLRLSLGIEPKITFKDFLREVPSATKEVFTEVGRKIGKLAENIAVSTANFFKTSGSVIGEGLAYAFYPKVREQYLKGHTEILPTISKETPFSVAKKTIAAGIELSLFKAVPLSAKYKWWIRATKGAAEGIGYKIAEGLATDKSAEEILREIKITAPAGAAVEVAYPHLVRILKKEINLIPKSLKRNLSKIFEKPKTVEEIIEKAEGWKPGLKVKFDTALMRKDAKTIKELLPEVPYEYKLRFSKKISKILNVKPRKIITTIQESAQTTKELKKALGEIEPFYEPFTNKEALKEAERIIKQKGLVEAREIVFSVTEPPTATKSALTIKLLKHYEAVGDIDRVIEMLDVYDKQLRAAGRYIQTASLWNKLSPRTVLKITERVAKKYGQQLDEGTKKIIVKKFLEIQKIDDEILRNKETLNLLQYIADKVPLTKGEIFDLYRYTNMLSNPQSQERNIAGNLFQTFFTRPLDLLGRATYDFLKHPFNPAAREVYFSDIPRYYKTLFFHITDAIEAFVEGFRRGYVSEKILDIGNQQQIIEVLRRAKGPSIFTVIPRFMEAVDNFFSVLIAAGEKARLMRKGISEKVAIQKARKLAEYYLYRSPLGMERKSVPLLAKALDEIGLFLYQLRRSPVLGKVWGWVVPFIRTPINIAKLGVERSPLGFIGGSYSSEQISKALTGTVVTAFGAFLAMKDRITFLPPQDKKARQYFYDAGRKAFSVNVFGKWVPMWYFGPYAVALALPAAVKYYFTETRTAPTESMIDLISKTILGCSRIVVAQTPLTGLSGFFQAIQGDIDYTIPSQIAWTLKQAVPFSGLVRYINSWLDPIYRRSRTFEEALKKDLIFFSKELPPYERSTGEPSEKEIWDKLLPWGIGIPKEEFDKLYKKRIKKLQELERLKIERGATYFRKVEVPFTRSFRIRPITK